MFMNYSEQEIRKKERKLFSRKKRIFNRIRFYLSALAAVFIAAVFLVVGSAVYGSFSGLLDSTPDINEIDLMPEGYPSKVYDADGNRIQTLVGSDANRIYMTIDNIPSIVQNAFISIEDARFYEHEGIDLQGIVRAVYNGVTNKDEKLQGASTITQQLLKNQVFGGGNEKGFFPKLARKVREQCLAIELESSMDKEQILEYYLNTINLGQNTLGVEVASRRYFDKSVSELTVSEAAVLAGITQNPTEYNPITNPRQNEDKRKLVLKNMLEQGYLSEEVYEDALGDDVYTRIKQVNRKKRGEKTTINSYYVDAVIEQVVSDLKTELGYTETQAYNAVYRRGLSIYTCQDKKIQSICDEVISDEKYYPENSMQYLSYSLTVRDVLGNEKTYHESDLQAFINSNNKKKTDLYFKGKGIANKYIKRFKKSILVNDMEVVSENISFTKEPQVSFVLIDQKNGKVKAIVGGRGDKTANRTLNRATTAKRQPGSTFKVVSTYLPALDTSGMTLASVEDDSEYTYPGTKIKVKNWDTSGYKGLTSLREGIVNSMNIVTVRALEKVTPQTGYDYLLNLGFTTLVSRREMGNGKNYTDINYPMALGGLTDGVTNLELTAAYSSISNGGTYTEPVFYTKIVDSDGKVLIEKKPKTKRVMKADTAWLLTDALEEVVSRGTGKAAGFDEDGISVAGKTGTTSGNTDFWFVGYTPYYTAGIWTGYDMNTEQESTDYHKRMWSDIMKKVHHVEKLTSKKFSKPKNIISREVCTKCGKLAVYGLCNEAEGGSCIRLEYFAKGTEPKESCDCHVRYYYSKSTGYLVTEYTSQYDVETRVLLKKKEKEGVVTADTPYIAK